MNSKRQVVQIRNEKKHRGSARPHFPYIGMQSKGVLALQFKQTYLLTTWTSQKLRIRKQSD